MRAAGEQPVDDPFDGDDESRDEMIDLLESLGYIEVCDSGPGFEPCGLTSLGHAMLDELLRNIETDGNPRGGLQ